MSDCATLEGLITPGVELMALTWVQEPRLLRHITRPTAVKTNHRQPQRNVRLCNLGRVDHAGRRIDGADVGPGTSPSPAHNAPYRCQDQPPPTSTKCPTVQPWKG